MSNHPSGPPYAPSIASVGGIPSIGIDVPTSAVFMFLYIVSATGHMTIFQINKRRGQKFIMSGMMFGYSVARTLTMILRIVWAVYPHDIQIAIAAQIFVSAGVLILFIINLIFAQRITRAAHPHFGWHRALSNIFKVLYVGVAVMLAMVITATVQSFYTLNPHVKRIDRDLQITASTYLLLISFLPIPMVIFSLIVPRKTRLDKFGSGRWRSKIWILLASTVLLCLGASFRTATTLKNPRPINDPAWYQAKWCFYFFNFVIEIIVIYLCLLVRVDRRFIIPNGSKGPGDYVRQQMQQRSGENVDELPRRSMSSTTHILSEEEVFDDMNPVERTLSKENGSPV
ncbi:uncharacterized protein A1O9_08216 [Exophiala aquamarina CBS 119918]|uniref:Uncharacterized protein n=1 Tax=Exophiala aquamarina CBS 119918 TaxID=1182545 RepID=A0A072P6H4_9EURO|nr:uncharacterized protein A1O9_08216 [Exophiala aquamarina CBS 119918]KEF55466.1 hypothetical protein A1O9_08216 [Exophiala aquamarina CBS 119918]